MVGITNKGVSQCNCAFYTIAKGSAAKLDFPGVKASVAISHDKLSFFFFFFWGGNPKKPRKTLSFGCQNAIWKTGTILPLCTYILSLDGVFFFL